MGKLIPILVILGLLLALKFFLKNENNTEKPILTDSSFRQPADNNCVPIDRYMYEHPDATEDELIQAEKCSKARAARLGLDKANTSFLGNTYKRPKGALAHYESGGGGNIFTVYDDYILANASGGPESETIIEFSQVTDVKRGQQLPNSVRIEYTSQDGSKKAYAFLLMRNDDALKAEGATDLDRLIALLEKQKNKYRE